MGGFVQEVFGFFDRGLGVSNTRKVINRYLEIYKSSSSLEGSLDEYGILSREATAQFICAVGIFVNALGFLGKIGMLGAGGTVVGVLAYDWLFR